MGHRLWRGQDGHKKSGNGHISTLPRSLTFTFAFAFANALQLHPNTPHP